MKFRWRLDVGRLVLFSRNPQLDFVASFPDDASMHIEHVGVNHPDPVAAAAWYSKNLGMKIVRTVGPPTHGTFMADAAGKSIIELYNNPKAPMPDYRSMHWLVLHFAFQVDDVRATHNRLVQAGATPEVDIYQNEDGDELAMVRDPWGLVIQLVHRGQPLL